MREQRMAIRVRVDFSVRWQGTWARRDGSLANLSTGGCFILTQVLVKPGEPVRLEIKLPQGYLHFLGEVVRRVEDVGFAMRFTEASEDHLKQLQWLIKAEVYRVERGMTGKHT
jgi:hypothetical protein